MIDRQGNGRTVERWAVVRVVLGNVQMAGAVASVVLLAMLGPTPPTLWTVGVTAAVMLASVYLFRIRRYGQRPYREE